MNKILDIPNSGTIDISKIVHVTELSTINDLDVGTRKLLKDMKEPYESRYYIRCDNTSFRVNEKDMPRLELVNLWKAITSHYK